jgi:hypothetical protein
MKRYFAKRWLVVSLFAAVAWTQTSKGQAASDKEDSPEQPAPATVGTRPSYPGLPRGAQSTKVETEIGPMKVRFYGTILFNSSISDRGVIGQEIPLWAATPGGGVTYPDGTVGRAGNNHDLVFTMRQSIVGFTLNPAKPSASGWNPSALFEMDFFGSRTQDTFSPENRVFNQPRLRLGYFQLEHQGLKFVFGQDKMILAPLDPVSLSHVGVPLGATAGDLWGWFPQARVDWSSKMGKTGLLVQLGILRPQFGDTRLETSPTSGSVIDLGSSGLGERSSQPFYQGRIAISPSVGKRSATFGVSGHFGEEKVSVNRNLQSWAVAADMRITIDPHLILRGEGFAGSNLIPFQGGIFQGAAALGSLPGPTSPGLTRIQRIGDGGGWLEAIVPMNGGKDTLYFGAGTDDPKNRNLLPGTTRAKNSFLWASYFRKITNEVTAAFEWSYWDFRNIAFPVSNDPTRQAKAATGTANVYNISLAYQF